LSLIPPATEKKHRSTMPTGALYSSQINLSAI
jgi:hypothetical protein